MTVKPIRRQAKRIANLIERMYGIRIYPFVTTNRASFIRKIQKTTKEQYTLKEGVLGQGPAFRKKGKRKAEKLRTFAFVDVGDWHKASRRKRIRELKIKIRNTKKGNERWRLIAGLQMLEGIQNRPGKKNYAGRFSDPMNVTAHELGHLSVAPSGRDTGSTVGQFMAILINLEYFKRNNPAEFNRYKKRPLPDQFASHGDLIKMLAHQVMLNFPKSADRQKVIRKLLSSSVSTPGELELFLKSQQRINEKI